MADLTDEVIALAHLEGFLYSIQTLHNSIVASPGTCLDYNIWVLDPDSASSDQALVVHELLRQIQYNETITPKICRHFAQKLQPTLLTDWKTQVEALLKRWFIDQYVSATLSETQATTFMALLAQFMGGAFEVVQFDLKAVEQGYGYDRYPYAMQLYWGMESTLLLFSCADKKVLLHLGEVLT